MAETSTRLGRVTNVVQYLVAVATLTVIVLLFTLGPDGSTPSSPSSDEYGPRADGETSELSLGAQIYESRCSVCHGATGGGGAGPRLAGVMTDLYPDPADQEALVSGGRNGMPAFSSRLAPTEIAAVVAFTRDGL